MAPPKTAAAPKTAAPAKSPAKVGDKKVVKKGKPRNYDLEHGIYRFSRTKMFHKTARYKFLKKKTPPKERPKKLVVKEKTVGGDKNGGKRMVLIRKRPRSFPTAKPINKHPSKKSFRDQTRYTRQSLKPGKIVILLAGPHRGKRVVLLKVLRSGLLLVTGPFKINGCPMRRISQNYVIATRSRLRLPKDIIPPTVNDAYFRRKKSKKPKSEEVFAAPRQTYKVNDQRKTDQEAVDKVVLKLIKARKDKSVFIKYLRSMFGLKRTQYPHRMKF